MKTRSLITIRNVFFENEVLRESFELICIYSSRWISSFSRVVVISKFYSQLTVLLWNKVLWSDASSHMTSFEKSECIILEQSYNIDSRLKCFHERNTYVSNLIGPHRNQLIVAGDEELYASKWLAVDAYEMPKHWRQFMRDNNQICCTFGLIEAISSFIQLSSFF